MNNTLNCAIVGFGYMGQIRLKQLVKYLNLVLKLCATQI